MFIIFDICTKWLLCNYKEKRSWGFIYSLKNKDWITKTILLMWSKLRYISDGNFFFFYSQNLLITESRKSTHRQMLDTCINQFLIQILVYCLRLISETEKLCEIRPSHVLSHSRIRPFFKDLFYLLVHCIFILICSYLQFANKFSKSENNQLFIDWKFYKWRYLHISFVIFELIRV